MMYKKILFFLACISIWSCSKKNTTQVELHLSNCHNDTIFIKELTEEPYCYKDSMIIDEHGNIYFNLKIVRPAFYSIYKNKKSNITLYLNPNDKVEIKANLPEFTNLSIKGSDASVKINELIKSRNELTKKAYSIIDSMNAIRDSANRNMLLARYDTAIDKLIEKHKKVSIAYVNQNIESPICIIALQQYIGERPIFNPEKDFDLFIRADSILIKNHAAVEAVKFLHNQATYYRSLQQMPSIGKKAFDISLADTSGKIISLSSFKGRYVLLDFWASWCPSCRKENPFLLRAYWKYHWKKLDIFQVSLDKTKQAWVNAIKTDRLANWYHVSDLKMWNSVVVPLYQLTEIPANFLINPDGIIIGRNIPGAKLDEVLDGVINSK